ncbi:MAG: hypothetical protein J7623_16095 [Chitinophaga sp.]|uniref:hypothetical protein n=1 Tax=Chitinophaga sp. TaxID=1869181 RepID=UPI001B0C8504|nr:hypothetical protein [Chitinophaga sp.]MBO9730161.1 hypothetical protein [Chitinophaga sp.]
MTLEALKEELLARWLTAYDEINTLENYQDQTVSWVYADRFMFDLSTYTKEGFPPGKGLLNEPPSEGEYFTWGLDAVGRPCYYNGRNIWKGFFTYSDGLVEYVDYDIDAAIPNRIVRIVYQDGRKVSYQRFSINGGTWRVKNPGNTKEDKLRRLMKDSSAVICSVEQYHYEGDHIAYADCLFTYGKEKHYSTNTYTYTTTGDLYNITRIDPNGSRRCLYAQPITDITLEELQEEVAHRMAADVVNTLVAYDVDVPLAVLEIGYRVIANYMPMLRVVSQANWRAYVQENGEEELFALLVIGGDSDYIELIPQKSDHLFTAFTTDLKAQDIYEPAEAMIRRVGQLLTAGLVAAKLPVTEDFIAFAADWSMADDLAEVLKDGGMPEKQVANWRERGII